MSERPSDLSAAILRAGTELDLLVAKNPYPELQHSLEELASAYSQIRLDALSDQFDEASIAAVDRSIVHLGRRSAAETNAAPRGYQQPIFQSLGDYQLCAKQNKTSAAKILCVSLFILSLASNLLSISIKR